MSDDTWVALAVALGVGLLVGVERERRKGRGPDRQAAGLRTFALVTVAGALAQSSGTAALVVAGAVAVAALAALAYWQSVRSRQASSDPGLTTEVALIVAYLVGVQCAIAPALGAACGVVLAALLAARERMHRFATEWLTEQELRDALVLGGVALVVVPLAPAEPLPGLGSLAPRTAAWLVLLILTIQAAAHVARRFLGAHQALLATGVLGGFVSSTATVATLGAQARQHPGDTRRRLAGAASASAAATWLQALGMAALTSASLVPAVALVSLSGAAVVALAGAWWARAGDGDTLPFSRDERRPLRLREALVVAALLLGVSVVVGWLRGRFGAAGLMAGSALAALADAHAPVANALASHAQAQIDGRQALSVVLLAVGVNSISRSVVALASGGAAYGLRVTAALLLSWSAAAAAAFALLGWTTLAA